MTTLAKNTPRTAEIGTHNEFPVIAADIIFDGAYVGDNGLGYARPLVAGDRFRGYALRKADNSTGSAGDIRVMVQESGKFVGNVPGAVITDVGAPVYATDDDTLTLSPVGGSYIGDIHRFISAGVVTISFDATRPRDPYGSVGEVEVVSANKTLDAEDTGKTFLVDTDGVVISIPATATALACRIVNIGADGAVGLSLSPVAADKIMGPDIAGTDNKDLINTKATARRGDFVRIQNGHADGPVVTEIRGIWETETP
jgi:hypothetical protein